MRRALLAVLTAGLLLSGAVPARALEEISAVSGGKELAPLQAYQIGKTFYLSAREAGALYGAQVYWYPVSGRVQMSLRGRALQLLVGAQTARGTEGTLPLEEPVILRGSQAYVPLSFFLSPAFSEWSERATSFNERTRLLTVEKIGSVGPVRWFSYPDRTRVVLDLAPRLTASASARGLGGIQVTVPLGVVEAAEQGEVSDGVLRGYALKQAPKAAALSLFFDEPGARWRSMELHDPHRFVVEVFSGEGASAGAAAPPAAAKSPAPAAPPQAKAEPAADKAAAPAPLPAGEPRRRRIVIDAGHGGKDSGATGRRGTLEKEINLMAAVDLARLLKEEEVFEVKLTRDDDTFVPLSDRSKLANEFGADLFVSLHCNASPNRSEEGYEVYFLSEKASDPEAERLAEFENSVLALEGKTTQEAQADLLLLELSKTENINAAAELAGLVAKSLEKRSPIANRGVKQAAFYVLRGTHAPAILLEMAFISNRKDETRLESRRSRRKVVDALYAGIVDYARRQGWMGGGPQAGTRPGSQGGKNGRR